MIIIFFSILALSGIVHAMNVPVSRLKISSYNIRNFKHNKFDRKLTDENGLYKILKNEDSEIVGIQEIFDFKGFEQFIKKYLPEYGLILSQCGGRGKQKLGFLYRKETIILEKFEEYQIVNKDNHCYVGVRPLVLAQFSFKKTGFEFWLINLHLKAGGKSIDRLYRRWQFNQISNFIKNQQNRLVAYGIIGDLNTTDYIYMGEEYRRLRNLFRRFNLVNTTQDLACSAYWNKRGKLNKMYPALLDHIAISERFFRKFYLQGSSIGSHCEVNRCKIVLNRDIGDSYQYISDHCPISTVLGSVRLGSYLR